jgi:malonate transporter and related proteins
MAETLSITGSIFALIALGFLAARARLFGAGAVDALGAYVVNLALPALIFTALAARDLAEVVDAGYLAAYLAGSLATLSLGYFWSRRVAGLPALASTFRAMGMSCTNSGLMGYPILAITMPEVAGRTLALNMMVENLVLIPLILVMAEAGGRAGASLRSLLAILRRLATSPIILAIVAGVAVAFSGATIPAVLDRAAGLLAASSAAVSLVVIGGSLAGLPVGGPVGSVAPVVAGKLAVHPLAVGVALAAMPAVGVPVETALVPAGIVMAAMPAMGIYPILAGRYGEGRIAAVAMLAMTVLSFATVNGLLLILD